MDGFSRDKGWIRVLRVKVDGPGLKDNTADTDRLIREIRKSLDAETVTLDLVLIRRIPFVLRENAYHVEALLYEKGGGVWHLMDLYPTDCENAYLGAAVDLGTTTVVVRLLDLLTGEQKAEASFSNPQIPLGADILTRIHHASSPEGLAELRQSVLESLNRELGLMTEGAGVDNTSIVGVALAGNTTMSHFFLGLDPHWICREPYIPVINTPDLFPAKELGLNIHPEAPVLVLPNVGSYFGGDLIAGILASGMHREEALSLLVDVGTNAEVVLGNRDWLVGCAGAAGPALEGGVASIGMAAAAGAIDRVNLDPDSGELRIRTIGNQPAVGICGSGLIDLVARLFLSGRIDARGKFVPGRCGDRLRQAEGMSQFVVVSAEDSGTGKDLSLRQTDL
ncbi:MAG: DUF4445 domain-containing protein, partial [Deltaproteobacteria bacterium]|nr:DUF4445 domain-containing protein [Deltaproteobacteria bacterium]